MVGTSSEMMLTPFGALAAGFLAGTVSTLGYKFFTVQTPLQPWAEQGVSNRSGVGGAHETHYWCPVL